MISENKEFSRGVTVLSPAVLADLLLVGLVMCFGSRNKVLTGIWAKALFHGNVTKGMQL
jgi:hypothetical protein